MMHIYKLIDLWMCVTLLPSPSCHLVIVALLVERYSNLFAFVWTWGKVKVEQARSEHDRFSCMRSLPVLVAPTTAHKEEHEEHDQ
jgi:hypothetical protein